MKSNENVEQRLPKCEIMTSLSCHVFFHWFIFCFYLSCLLGRSYIKKNLTEREIMRMLSSGKKFIATFVVVLMPKLMMDGDISSSRVKGGNGKAGYFLKHFSHRITSQSIQTIFFVIHGDEKKEVRRSHKKFYTKYNEDFHFFLSFSFSPSFSLFSLYFSFSLLLEFILLPYSINTVGVNIYYIDKRKLWSISRALGSRSEGCGFDPCPMLDGSGIMPGSIPTPNSGSL